MTLGEVVKQYRLQHELSMDAFASLSGLSKGYISMLEKNRNPRTKKPIIPSIETYYGIAKAMGISIETLMTTVGTEQLVKLPTSPPQKEFTEADIELLTAYHKAPDYVQQAIALQLSPYYPKQDEEQIS